MLKQYDSDISLIDNNITPQLKYKELRKSAIESQRPDSKKQDQSETEDYNS
jgi:hypothetical protein